MFHNYYNFIETDKVLFSKKDKSLIMRTNLLFALSFITLMSYAQQIPDDIKPPSWSQHQLSQMVPHKLPLFDVEKIQKEDVIKDQNKSIPWRFGHEIYVGHNFNDVGEWTTLDNGDRIWRMTYTSKNAQSLNFMFDVFKIPEGAKLYVYNNAKDDLLRPFTHHNNNPEEVLGTWLVQGNQAWVEYYQPSNVVGEAKITIGSVVHGYRSAESYQKALGDSRDCNQDVDCDITYATDLFELNTRKEEVKKAVGLLVTGGTGFCSGTLINNTNNDGTPYFITANHCAGEDEGSWAFRFNWRSPEPSCSTTSPSVDGSYNQTVSGAILRANSSRSDMKLVEITDMSFFSNNPEVVWSGWNRSKTEVPSVNFGIHHPSGDIQKVSRDDNGAYRASTSVIGKNTQVWRIDQWELGTTEKGSSGSGLFNQNGHLIGVLAGGLSACKGTSNNGRNDFYGRFGVAWDYGNSPSSRLKEWLDPSNLGIEVLDRYPMVRTYDIDARVASGTHNSFEICEEDFTPKIILINSGVLALTSADISYNIDEESSTIINWTGNLESGENIVIATPIFSDLSPGNHALTISVSNPNGTVDENPNNDTNVFNFKVWPSYETSTIILNILTDDYPKETSWGLFDSSGTEVLSGPTVTYSPATSYQETITIPNKDECYTFTLFDEAGDGICCDWNGGSYSLEDENGNIIISGGDFSYEESVLFSVKTPLSVDEFNLKNWINIYPNPVNDNLIVTLTRVNDNVDFQIFNTLGQQVGKGNLASNQTHILNMSSYQSGIYFIKLSTSTNSMVQKLIKN